MTQDKILADQYTLHIIPEDKQRPRYYKRNKTENQMVDF